MANVFWTGGTGTWDGGTLDSGRWVTASGGSTTTTAPTSIDTAVFDALSGGGTVTVAGDFNISSIQFGSHTGTLDFSINNNSVNVAGTFGGTGTGARTLKLGSATITCGLWQLTGTNPVLFDAGTSTIRVYNAGITGGFQAATSTSHTYNKVMIGPPTTGIGTVSFSGGIPNINTLEFNNTNVGAAIQLTSSANITINNSFYWKGSARRPITIFAGSSPPSTITLGAGKTGVIEWASLAGMTFTGGGTFIAKNCFDSGGNTGITFIDPATSAIGAR